MAPLLFEEQTTRPNLQFSRAERLEQLERIVASPHFRNSKRYPSFLRYVVERTVDEDSEVLKERTLGIEIFARPTDYDTNADPIVRVTAGEVRKRIAQYYQSAGHEHELRIELPLGSYVPHFSAAPQHVSDQALGKAKTEPATVLSMEKVAEPHASESEAASLEIQRHPALQEGTAETATLPQELKPGIGPWLRIFALLVVTVPLVMLGTMLVTNSLRAQRLGDGARYFWQPTLSVAAPVLLVMGVHSTDNTGKSLPTDSYAAPEHSEPQSYLSSMIRSDMVPVSDMIGFSRITDLLTQRSHVYRTVASTETTLEEMRHAPVVLIGAFNNIWTKRLTSSLRFRFVEKSYNLNGIQDGEHPERTWILDNTRPLLGKTRDYAIVASYFDPTIEQHVMIAAGIEKSGTLAATEFLTSEQDMSRWLKEAKVPANKNVELVLETDVLDGEPEPPHVIASAIW